MGDPRAGISHPRAGISHPRAGSVIPVQGSVIPAQGSVIPAQGSAIPVQGQSSPCRDQSSPCRDHPSPDGRDRFSRRDDRARSGSDRPHQSPQNYFHLRLLQNLHPRRCPLCPLCPSCLSESSEGQKRQKGPEGRLRLDREEKPGHPRQNRAELTRGLHITVIVRRSGAEAGKVVSIPSFDQQATDAHSANGKKEK